MGRILKFNTDKCNATIAQYKEDIAKIDDHLAHIVDYTADWFMMLKEKYGKNYPRMTEVRNFDTIEATKSGLRRMRNCISTVPKDLSGQV
mgnify:CR=1 FL=1